MRNLCIIFLVISLCLESCLQTCLFPVASLSQSYFGATLSVVEVVPSPNRFNSMFPRVTYLQPSTGSSMLVYRQQDKSSYGSVTYLREVFKKVSVSKFLFLLSYNNILKIQSVDPNSIFFSFASFSNVTDFCYSQSQNILVTLFLNSTVNIYYFSENEKANVVSFKQIYTMPFLFSQIACGDAFYLLLHQNGTLFGAGNTACGRLGMYLPKTKEITFPTPILNFQFSSIRTLFNITIAQLASTQQWLYWGANYPAFFENQDEFCFYFDPVEQVLATETVQFYLRHFEFFYFKSVTGFEHSECIYNELKRMNGTSVFMGNSLLVISNNGSVYSNDLKFIFYENSLTGIVGNAAQAAVLYEFILLIVVQILHVIWCVRCGRRRYFNQVDGLKTVGALLQIPIQLLVVYLSPIWLGSSFFLPIIVTAAILQLMIVIGVDLVVFISCIRDLCSLRRTKYKNSQLSCKLVMQLLMSSFMWILFFPYELIIFFCINDNTGFLILQLVYIFLTMFRSTATVVWVECNAYWPICVRKAALRIKTNQAKRLAKIEMDLTQRLLGYEEGKPKIKLNRKLFEIPYQELEELSQIGAGGSGSLVFKAKWKGKPVALKLFSTTDETMLEDFENEAEVMMSIRHPNIVTIFGVVVVDRIGLVLQYCSKGSLFKVIQNESQPLLATIKLKWLRQIASGIKYLHDRNILHRDIKSENILIDEFDNALIADFGTSKFCAEDSTRNTFSAKGTAAYIAPEVVREMPYGFKADVFSFAIVMYEIVMNTNKPYGIDTKYGIEFKVEKDPNFRPLLPSNYSNNTLLVLIKQCWEDDAEKRPTLDSICNLLDQVEEQALTIDKQ